MNKYKYFEEILKIYSKENYLTLSDVLIKDFKVEEIQNFNDNNSKVNDKINDKTNKEKQNKLDTKQRNDDNVNSNKLEDLEIYHKLQNCKEIKDIRNILDTKEILNQNFFLNRFAKNIVIGDGNEGAKILLIGEAPGETEDEMGIPFCGRSGKLLEKALSTIKLTRKDNIYITNTVFWRPENNRKPTKEELEFCFPFLKKIIQIINPQIIITAGGVATELMLDTNKTISNLIGKFNDIEIDIFEQKKKIKVFPIYHPSYLLRSPSSKKTLWNNLLRLAFFLQQC